MNPSVVSFFVGLIFAIGLGVSGMTQPEKVFGFLDIFGRWDPSLMFVMVGAIGIHAVAYRFILRRSQPLFSSQWHLPEVTRISPRLVFGAVLFGIGWALAGYCPGPAITSLATGETHMFLFVAAMIGGMFIGKAAVGR